jgi:hypothetical protein
MLPKRNVLKGDSLEQSRHGFIMDIKEWISCHETVPVDGSYKSKYSAGEHFSGG